MRIELAAFTDRGLALAGVIATALNRTGDKATVARPGPDVSLRDWTERAFRDADALVFVGAVGIAVRAVAPFIRDKTTDPAVIAVDDHGRFAVAVLSGHIGGANALTERVAKITGAVPVVTTATDNAGVFAVDTWAVRNNLVVINPNAIKSVSAKLLRGDSIVIQSAYPVTGTAPDNVILQTPGAGEANSTTDATAPDVVIDINTTYEKTADASGLAETPAPLRLAPRALVLGSGCRRGTPAAAIAAMFEKIVAAAKIHPEAVASFASIVIKKNEPGLVAFAAERRIPFVTFTAEELRNVEGDFASSKFVEETVGVDNVAERAAVLASNGGRLYYNKVTASGVTMALALGPVNLAW